MHSSNQILKLYFLYLGAFGYFECTHDITKYTKAKPFEFVGKKTPLAVRFSTVGEYNNQISLTSHDVSTVLCFTDLFGWGLFSKVTTNFYDEILL